MDIKRELNLKFNRTATRTAKRMTDAGCIPVMVWVPPSKKKELEAFAAKLRAEKK